MVTKVLNAIEKINRFLSGVCILSLIAVVLLQVFARFLLPRCPSWTEELARIFYIHAIALTAPLSLRYDQFVKVDTLVEILPRKLNIALNFISRLIVLAICIIFAYTSYGFMKSGLYETSVALVWPMVVPFSALFICGVLMVLFSIENIYKDISRITKGNVSKDMIGITQGRE